MTSHWIVWDAPEIGRGRQRAICGEIVDSTTHANDPNCHECQDAIRELDDALQQERESERAQTISPSATGHPKS